MTREELLKILQYRLVLNLSPGRYPLYENLKKNNDLCNTLINVDFVGDPDKTN